MSHCQAATPDTRNARPRTARWRFGVCVTRLSGVGLGGVEPPTSRLSGVRSNHLSYRPGQDSEIKSDGDRGSTVEARQNRVMRGADLTRMTPREHFEHARRSPSRTRSAN